MKFGLAIEKKNSMNLTQAEEHNARLHATKSQLPKPSWMTPQGHHTIKAWDQSVVDEAKGLAKRKDAVLGLEFIFQVGNQTDWRDLPTDDDPHGKPKPGNSKKMNALIAGVKAAVTAEFGWDRVISADLHTDESSPHLHVVFAPIFEGKLQSKRWVGGSARCAQLRERLYDQVNKHLACEYTKGEPGGAPHDPEKAAGKSRSVGAGVVASLKNTIQQLEQQVQTLFSRLKSEQQKARAERADHDNIVEKAAKKMEALQAEIARLKPRPATTPPPPPEKRPVEPPRGSSGLPPMTPKHRAP